MCRKCGYVHEGEEPPEPHEGKNITISEIKGGLGVKFTVKNIGDNDTEEYFNSTIDEVRIYNHSLTEDE